MKTHWTVYTNYIGDGKVIVRVGRKLRENEPLHSGNVEYTGDIFEDEDAARAYAVKLNAEAEERDELRDIADSVAEYIDVLGRMRNDAEFRLAFKTRGNADEARKQQDIVATLGTAMASLADALAGVRAAIEVGDHA